MTTRLENGELIDLTPEEEAELQAREADWTATAAQRAREKMVCTRFQALAVLDQAGLLSQIESIMANPQTPNITKLAWNHALEFKRTSPTLISLGAMIGLTDAQLDDLFIQAKSIEA